MSKLTFSSVIDTRNGFVYQVSEIPGGGIASKANLDIGMLFSNKNFFVGYAINHLNEANVSFTNKDYHLPKRFNFQFGANKHFGKNGLVRLAIQSNRQGEFQHIAMTAQIQLHHILAGIGYRDNFNSPLIRLGVVTDKVRFIYNYDFSSRNTPSSGGSHEFIIQFLLNLSKVSNSSPIEY